MVMQTAKGRGPVGRDCSKRPAHAAEEHELKRIQAREGLQFDQPRNQTVPLGANAQINDKELRVRRFVRHGLSRWNRRSRVPRELRTLRLQSNRLRGCERLLGELAR